MYGAMLVSCLTDRPFRYFDRITANTIDPSFKAHADWWPERTSELRKEVTPNPAGGYFVKHKGLAKQAPGKYPFLGKVFVLIDGGTFSTAADFCAVTHHLKRATFIGEETGGGYYGSNSGLVTRLTLPTSKFKVRLPMYEYWNAVSGYEGRRRGTIPDHVVKTKTANLVRGVVSSGTLSPRSRLLGNVRQSAQRPGNRTARGRGSIIRTSFPIPPRTNHCASGWRSGRTITAHASPARACATGYLPT